MNGIDLERYIRDETLRAALEARARRERAETVHRLLLAAARSLARLPARLRRLLAAPGPANSTKLRTRGCG